MKIVKRDGRIVEYNRDKIKNALLNCNTDVIEQYRINNKQIDNIIKNIEEQNINKKRMLVEDIQDIIETELMKIKKYELAKAYIIYRYNRALIRKNNTTDETIMTIIKNSNNINLEEINNKNAILASTQRDLIAGEVSKDLTKRILLPEKISKAHESGILYFHDSDYFLQSIFNSIILDYSNMFNNTTVINDKLIEKPKSFRVACLVLTQIIMAVQSSQYGGITIDIKHLGEYLKLSEDKIKEKYKNIKSKLETKEYNLLIKNELLEELKLGIELIQYQINTLTTNGLNPTVTLFLDLDESDKYIKYTEMIIEEILKQKTFGIKNTNNILESTELPKLVYLLNKNNIRGTKYYNITKLAIECAIKTKEPSFMSEKIMINNYNNKFIPLSNNMYLNHYKEDKNKYEGRFNQGIVTLNLVRIGLLSENNENNFFNILDEYIELCFEALMCRHHALLGTYANISPIDWIYGGITRLNEYDKIDKYLKNSYSTLSLGFIGLNEATRLITNKSMIEKEGELFSLKVIKYLNKKVKDFKLDTNLGFTLYSTPSNIISHRFNKLDKEEFGIIKDITDKDYYTNSYHLDEKDNIDIKEKLLIEQKYANYVKGGNSSIIDINYLNEDLLDFIYNNVLCVEFK